MVGCAVCNKWKIAYEFSSTCLTELTNLTGSKVYLKNEGNFLLEDVQLYLLPSGQLVNIIEGTTFLGDINYGEVSGSSNLSD